MYIKVNGYNDTIKITYYKYSLFTKRKIYKTKEVDSYGLNHWYTIIRDTENINDLLIKWQTNEEEYILNKYKCVHKKWHDIQVKVTIRICVEKISDLTMEQAMKLLTPQQFKEEFRYLKTLEK